MNEHIVKKLLKVLHEKSFMNEQVEELARALRLNEPLFQDVCCDPNGSHDAYQFARLGEQKSYSADVFSKICDLLADYMELFNMIGRELNLDRNTDEKNSTAT